MRRIVKLPGSTENLFHPRRREKDSRTTAPLRRSLVAIVGVASLLAAPEATATAIVLSSHSNDPGVDAELLAATLDFRVVGNTFTLTATNDTSAPNAFEISSIYFNASDAVTGLSLTSSPPNWRLRTGGAVVQDFGRFDFELRVQNNQNAEIQPGAIAEFVFTVSGLGPFEDADFTDVFSRIPPGTVATIAAVKFVNGPGGIGAAGAFHIPEPGALPLLGLGLAGLAALRRARLAR